jgi:hypothetical protein
MSEPTKNSEQTIDNFEHDELFRAKRITDVGSDNQLQVDDTTTTNVIYVGTGARGLTTSTSGWLITKYDLTSGVVGKNAIDAWDNRVSATYS